MVRNFIKQSTLFAKMRGFLTDWMGRRHHFPDSEYAYKGPNSLIQGGASSIAKLAMNATDAYLLDKKSYLQGQVHDQLDFAVHPDELWVVPDLQKLMEDVYPYKYLPQTCSVSHSWKSFGDLEDGLPSAYEAA